MKGLYYGMPSVVTFPPYPIKAKAYFPACDFHPFPPYLLPPPAGSAQSPAVNARWFGPLGTAWALAFKDLPSLQENEEDGDDPSMLLLL
nr:hypothetical protein Iba_chr04bCG10470 [Ipomoea batatas]